MKIILSRKGFDQKYGGAASPIFPNNDFYSLPIPEDSDPITAKYRVKYKSLARARHDGRVIVEDLTFKPRKGESRLTRTDICHLDPDLIRDDRPRSAGWLPMFGQGNQATSHLLNHGVREGDLFLFFGWFRRVQRTNGRFGFVPDGQSAHVIFGWLQVGEIWCAFNEDKLLPKWALGHAHVCGDKQRFRNLGKPVNAVFIAKRRLEIPGLTFRRPRLGGGVFTRYHDDLCLTEPGRTRGHWRLPLWMYPSDGRTPMSYNVDRRKWQRSKTHCFLHAADIGQEFIIDCEAYCEEEINEWLRRLFSHAV